MAAGKSRALRIIGVLLALVVAGLTVEGASSFALMARDLRSIQPAENFRQAQYDSLLGWVGLPNLHNANNYGPNLVLTTNAEGMRIHSGDNATLAPGERRVICSGDSFTFGSGVADNETFCSYFEKQFPGVRSLNMSQRGYGIDQAYLWYRRDAVRYPHQVHLFAFIWNDFERMALTEFFGYAKPILKLESGKIVAHNVPVPAWTGSSQDVQVQSVLGRSRLMQLVQRRVGVSDSAKMARVDAQVWDVAAAVFTDLQKLNQERHSQLVLVYLPTMLDYEKGAYDSRRERLANFSQQSGIPLVDLTTDLRKVAPDSLRWMFITANGVPVNGSSGHFTARGHEWAAERIAEHVRTMPPVVSALIGTAPGAKP
ncbi:MAG: hypothetical protein ABI852_01370 [Gemmatimonadaceae bacterium]